MSAWLLLFAALVAAAQASEDPIPLTPGETRGEIDAQCSEIRTAVLGGRGYRGRNPGRRYLFTPEHGGEFSFQLESSEFDAYLVLRDPDGAVLAEDDDGFILPDAQIVAQLEAGQDYLLEAVAVHGLTGSFLLRVLEGRPAAIPPETRNELALERLRQRLEEVQRTLGPEHPRYAARLELLATRLWWSGKYAEFVDLLRPVLGLCEQLRGPDHPDTARCMKHLADGLARIGQMAEAERMQRRALAIREGALGPDDPATLESLEGLALLLFLRGRDEEANAYLLRARASSRAAAVGDDDARTDTLCGLAWYLCRRKRYEEAEHYYRLALGDAPSNPDLRFDPWPLIGLAQCLLARDQYEEAEARLEQARGILEKEWGRQHSSWPEVLGNLAIVAQRRGDFERACLLQTQALERSRVALGPEHRSTALRCGLLARVLARLGRAEEAERLYSEALEIDTRALGADHSTTLNLQWGLATARLDLGRADEAWLLARESTQLAQQSLERSFEAASELDRFFHAAELRSKVSALISCTAEVPTEEREWATFDALLAWKGIVFRTLSRSRNSKSGHGSSPEGRAEQRAPGAERPLVGRYPRRSDGDRGHDRRAARAAGKARVTHRPGRLGPPSRRARGASAPGRAAIRRCLGRLLHRGALSTLGPGWRQAHPWSLAGRPGHGLGPAAGPSGEAHRPRARLGAAAGSHRAPLQVHRSARGAGGRRGSKS